MANPYARYGEFWAYPDLLRMAYNGVLRDIEINLTYAEDDVSVAMNGRDDVKNMPLFPAEGSIQEIDKYKKCTIIDMSNKVLEHIAKKYTVLKEGVKNVMGGKILEYEAKTIRNAGIAEGEARGRSEGEEKGIRSLTEVCQEFGSTLIDTVEKVAVKFGLDEETSRKKVLMYWKN